MVEMVESYFGGAWKRQRGQNARGKCIILRLKEREGRTYTKAMKSDSAEPLLMHIENLTRIGSIHLTDAIRGH